MPDRMTFQFLDVGMGDGTLVQIRETGEAYDKLILVDFGEKRTQFKVPYEDAMTYLVQTINDNSQARDEDRPFVDYLFLTHPDGDHYNKIEELVDQDYPDYPDEQLHFGDLYYSGNRYEYKDLIRNILPDLVDEDINEMQQSYHAEIDPNTNTVEPDFTFNNINVYILSANWPKRTGATNPKSIVLAFDLDGKQVILPGDAEWKTEAQILEVFGAAFVDSTGVKMGHHGSKNGSSQEWVDATSPEVIFASGDAAWAHPYCEAICRYIDHGSLKRFFNTDVYYCCGDAGLYDNNPTRYGICMSLNYIVLSAGGVENLRTNNHAVYGFLHNTFGVQWALQITEGRNPELLNTPLTRPAPGQAIPPPWDCNAVARAAACAMQPPPGVRAIDNPFGL